MNWIDKKVSEFDHLFCQCTVGTIPNTEEAYGLWDITRPEGDKDPDFKMIAEEMQDWLRTALQEAYDKGYEEGRVASLANIIPETIALAHTKGTQEALAKVEEWVKKNTDNYHGELFACVPAHDLLHHLQQLKDNKTV